MQRLFLGFYPEFIALPCGEGCIQGSPLSIYSSYISEEKILYGGVKAIVTFDTHLPLNERLMRIDHIQARRFSKLNGLALEIATEGIVRHLKACDRMDVNPETSAVREIIDDALNGRRVFAETKEHTRAA
jgi:hypothetical protein